MADHRLPSGKYTKSQKKYLRKWTKIQRKLDKLFGPLGYRCFAFDPDFALGKDKCHSSLNLPTNVAKFLVKRNSCSK